MLHLIWTDIQSVVQLKTQLLLKIKPLWDCVCCCTSTSTTECFTVWLYMQNPHFFACSRRCALPLAWTESNSSQLVFKCTAQNEYLTSQISRELTWIFFFHINFSRFFRLYGYSRRSVCACVSLHACVCNYKDFEWFLYYISNPTPLRGWQLQFSAPQRTVCVRANISCTTCLVTTVADTALRFMLCFPGRFSVKYTS